MISRLWGLLRAVMHNRARRPDQPRFLTFTVTFGCNARCIMCDSWKMSTEGDLSLAEIEAIFLQLPRLDAVRLTGGEPFVRTDLMEIATLAVTHLQPAFLHVTTNGFLTQRIVAFCESRPRRTPLDLLISMDGIGEKHNHIRGNSTAYESCLRTIQALAPRRRELNLSLAVNQTIVDAEGIEHYSRLRDLLRQYQVRNHVIMAYDTSATYNVQRSVDVAPKEMGEFTTFGEFTDDNLRELLDTAEADLSHYPWPQRIARRYYLRGIRSRVLGGIGAPNPRCVALNAHLRLFPNGDVPTCQFNSRTAGNLRQQTFQEVWNSVRAQEQRDWVKACPGCWAECEVLPSAVYTADLLFDLFRATPTTSGSRPRPLRNQIRDESPTLELVELAGRPDSPGVSVARSMTGTVAGTTAGLPGGGFRRETAE